MSNVLLIAYLKEIGVQVVGHDSPKGENPRMGYNPTVARFRPLNLPKKRGSTCTPRLEIEWQIFY